MSIYLGINGTQITNFIISTPFKDTIDEELDNFNFQIKSETRLTYKKNDRVVYSIKHGLTTILQKVFCIFNVVETWEGEKWLYQISCLSPTKLLENIIINGMADTYASARFDLQLDRVREKINAQLGFEMAVAPVLSFDSSISATNTTLYQANSSDFLWDGQVNVREIFNDMLDKVDMICIGTNFTIDANGNITAITIGAEKREKKGTKLIESANDIDNGGLEDVSEMVKGITFNRNSEFACGNIISLTKNAIAKDNVQQAYLPARNTDLTIDDADSWHIITQEPIYSLDKDLGCCVKVIVPSEVTQSTYVSSVNDGVPTTSAISSGKYYGREVDITDYIVEKSVFDNMSLSDQSKHLYFVRGQKNIYGLFKKYKSGLTGLYSSTAFVNIINDIGNINGYPFEAISHGEVKINPLLKWDNTNNEWTTSYDYTIKNGGWQVNDFYDLNLMNDTTLNTNKGKYSLFSINYQPYCDSVVKIERTNIADIEANSKNLSIIKNQSDRTVDAEKYFNSQQSLINRMGNKEMFIDCIVDLSQTYLHLKSLWDLGDYMVLNSKTWTITQREFTNYNETTLKVRYTLSKDYNGSNVDIQLNRDKRLYGIPLTNYVDRYILIRASGIDNYIKKILVQSWDDYTGSTTTMGYTIAEAIKIGNSSIVNKVARTYDNFACDIERTKHNSTIVNVYVRYCDTNGFKETIELYTLGDSAYSKLNIQDYSRLPFIPNSDVGQALVYGGHFTLTGIKKDKMERLIFVFREA